MGSFCVEIGDEEVDDETTKGGGRDEDRSGNGGEEDNDEDDIGGEHLRSSEGHGNAKSRRTQGNLGLSCAKIGEIEDGGHTHEGGWREDDRTGNSGTNGRETGDVDDSYEGNDKGSDKGREWGEGGVHFWWCRCMLIGRLKFNLKSSAFIYT